MARPKRKRKYVKGDAVAALRDRRAVVLGEYVGVMLQIANVSSRWYQWTCSLAIAIQMQSAITPPSAPGG